MRYESSHRNVKITAQSTSCGKNLLKTIAIELTLKMCQMIKSLLFKSKIKFGSSANSKHKQNYFSKEYENNKKVYYKDVTINGLLYKIVTIIVTNLLDSEIEFGKITEIISIRNEIYFNLCIIKETAFDNHRHAYIAEKTEENKILNCKDLIMILPTAYIVINDTLFVNCEYGL